MQRQLSTKAQAFITAVITLFIFSILLWDHIHGGVQSHHILDQEELPAISNWWGGLLLPVLSWILLGRIEKRLSKKAASQSPSKGKY